MNRQLITLFLSFIVCSVWAQDAVQEGSSEYPMSPDSIGADIVLVTVPQSSRFESEMLSIQQPLKPEIDKVDLVNKLIAQQTKPEVLLVPFTEIKTSYSGKADNDAILLLRRAINLTQLQYKSEHEYAPVSTRQTIDRVQFFLAQAAQNKLAGCGVQSELPSDDPKVRDVQEMPPAADYIYQVELGVSRLVINKTLFSASLTGEAEARVTENNRVVKKILIDSFGGGSTKLEKFGTEGAEAETELKGAASKVVEFLANRLGDKLCNYFN